MSKHIVGNMEGNDIYYISEKDLVFCKNTIIPYSLAKEAFRSSLTRKQLKNDLYYTTDGYNVTFGCLKTTKPEFKQFIKNIEKIKLNAKRK
jgi:hypothetical protein